MSNLFLKVKCTNDISATPVLSIYILTMVFIQMVHLWSKQGIFFVIGWAVEFNFSSNRIVQKRFWSRVVIFFRCSFDQTHLTIPKIQFVSWQNDMWHAFVSMYISRLFTTQFLMGREDINNQCVANDFIVYIFKVFLLITRMKMSGVWT